jgi:hypothetical protein
VWDALHCVSGTETFAVTWYDQILHYPDNLVDLLTVEVSSPRNSGAVMNCMCGFFFQNNFIYTVKCREKQSRALRFLSVGFRAQCHMSNHIGISHVTYLSCYSLFIYIAVRICVCLPREIRDME